MFQKELSIDQFDYILPEERIPVRPPATRDGSRLLVYQSGKMEVHPFTYAVQFLRSGDWLISNETKVIPARLFFKKETGARIEIFCLEPYEMDYQQCMQSTTSIRWKCLIGGAKKWKEEPLIMEVPLEDRMVVLSAFREQTIEGAFVVRFEWSHAITFSQVLMAVGEMPLPPYFNRDAEEEDLDRYQTLFAKYEGSVAAPTAGLHFSESVLQSLDAKGVQRRGITLHVGAGTFKPVSTATMADHQMHYEVFEVDITLIKALKDSNERIIAIGTTCTRTLESLYWLGVKCLVGSYTPDGILNQWEAYELPQHYSVQESLNTLITMADSQGARVVGGKTALMIAPGYRFRLITGIFTNFHLPKSTLLLLVAALIGDEDWKKVYALALEQKMNFLSYGDSSLLIP